MLPRDADRAAAMAHAHFSPSTSTAKHLDGQPKSLRACSPLTIRPALPLKAAPTFTTQLPRPVSP
jgi:hypothetical protein